MAKKTVRIEIPERSPKSMIELCGKIISKHKADGESSVLKSLDMATFEGKHGTASTKYTESDSLHKQAEAAHQEAMTAIGVAEGQNINTPDTLYSIIAQIRDMLLVLNKGNEEKLGDWGFDVVVS
jgi:hypothetical protein